MVTDVEQAFMDAVYPQLHGTTDNHLRAEAIKRTRRALVALDDAGFCIAARTKPIIVYDPSEVDGLI